MAEPLAYQEAGPQSCYRHPDRETGVRCTRCDRPICPECMTPASVGFQCPECIKEGRKTVRQPRTIVGARVSADSPVTRLILGINVAVFALAFLQVGGADVATGLPAIVAKLGMRPLFIAFQGDYYRLITDAFLHEQILHFGFNMYALLLLGDQVERVLGRWRYVSLYFAAALSGSAASYCFLAPNSVGLGASGAIFGLFGAIFVIQRRIGADNQQIVVILLLNLFLGFVIPGIDWRAHVGGLVAGALITAGYVHVGRGARRSAVHAGIVAIVVAATVGAVAARTAYLKDRYVPRPASVGAAGAGQPVKLALPEMAVGALAIGVAARSAIIPPPMVASTVAAADAVVTVAERTASV
jgi:membrane associated rhomboid family serine protease